MARAFIGLGSNMGDREANLENAAARVASIPGVTVLRKSSIAETEPVDYRDQPRFLNRIIIIETSLAPRDLLAVLQRCETELGREKSFPKGPRSIDLDILLYDDILLATAELTIPHPEIRNRPFILVHLVELEPELADPATGMPYREML